MEILLVVVVFLVMAGVIIFLLVKNQRLLTLVAEDALTGLKNRRSFDEEFLGLESQFQRPGDNRDSVVSSICQMVLDIDNFKGINDRYGHPFGDRVLKAVAEVIKNCFRRNQEVYRLGGEEFAVLLPNVSREHAVALAERVREAVESVRVPFDNGDAINVTISIGVAFAESLAETSGLYKLADKALYQAKKTEGKNTVVML